MAGFKVGDRVRLTSGSTMSAKPGATAVVTALGDTSDLNGIIQVEWDRDALSGNQMDGGYFEKCFELIPANPLADLNVGDKFTLEFEVISNSDSWIRADAVGVSSSSFAFDTRRGYQPGNIVRKPVEPAAGQLWNYSIQGRPDLRRRIIAVDSGYVFFMSVSGTMTPQPLALELNRFKENSTYVGPAES